MNFMKSSFCVTVTLVTCPSTCLAHVAASENHEVSTRHEGRPSILRLRISIHFRLFDSRVQRVASAIAKSYIHFSKTMKVTHILLAIV
jgi:hypothetical protein